MSFVLKYQAMKVSPLGGRIKLCSCSSCVWALRSLLNTEGILTFPMFLLHDRFLIQMWRASFAWWCRVLLSLSIIVKSLSFGFGCFVEMWWFLMALVVWYLWSETLFRDQFYDMLFYCSTWSTQKKNIWYPSRLMPCFYASNWLLYPVTVIQYYLFCSLFKVLIMLEYSSFETVSFNIYGSEW